MSQHSYQITVEGSDTLHNVFATLEFFTEVHMLPESDKKWTGRVLNMKVSNDLDYEFEISAGGKVAFNITITDIKTAKKILELPGFTDVKIPNAAKPHGSIKISES